MRIRMLRSANKADYFLLALIFILTATGLVILTSASSDLGKVKFNDSYYYLKHQLLYGFLPGLVAFLVFYLLDYRVLKKIAFAFLLANLGLLALVFTPLGYSSGGASRWLKFGPIIFQPAEFLKFTFIIYLAAWLASTKSSRTRSFFEGFLPFLVVCGITASLLLLQPATSTVAILMAAAVGVYFLSGAPFKYVGAMVLVGVALLAGIIYLTPYRFTRVSSFLNKGQDTQGTNYHSNQALIAIGSGKLWGAGYGNSGSKGFLPAVVDDSIFAVAAQEFGFIGSGVLVMLYALLTFRLFWLAKRARDQFGRLMLSGFGIIIAVQSLVNIGAISGLLPLTGIPLPLISYGGTALAVFLGISGLALNISKSA